MRQPKHFAFWRYDLFPFVLGSEVTQTRLDGWVETKSYGAGTYFCPLFITTVEKGNDIMRQLETLEKQRRTVVRMIEDGFAAQVRAIAPFARHIK